MLRVPALVGSIAAGVLLVGGCASSLPSASPAPPETSTPASPASSVPADPVGPSSSPAAPSRPRPDPRCGGVRVAEVAFQVGRPVDARRTTTGCAFTTKRQPVVVVQIGRQAVGGVPGGLPGAVQRVRAAMPEASFGTLQLARGGFIGVGDLASSTPIGGLGLAQVRRTLATVSVKQQAVPKRALDADAVSRLLVGMLALLTDRR